MVKGTLQDRAFADKLTSLDRGPVVVFWELTRACALKCLHCRANAQPKRHPDELITEECFHVLDDLASLERPPIVVLTGGDAFMRRDLFEIVSHGIERGLRMSVSPSATALVTKKRLSALRQAGVSRVSFSLDGSTPEIHDHFRGTPGSFQRTIDSISAAIVSGLSIQINTTVTQWNRADLPELEGLVASLGAPLWDLFFLVPTGRGVALDMLSPEEHDEVFEWVYEMEQRAPFMVKVTMGQPYRRVWLNHKLASEGLDSRALGPEELASLWKGGVAANDGRGIMFISHLGDVQPSGFLPLVAGNARSESVVTLYRESPLFRALRDTEGLKGKCGACPFRLVCGGCRARAYALTKDIMAGDPTCPFVAPGIED